MSIDNGSLRWVPEICYEEDGEGLTSKIPFVEVPSGEKMPSVLFIFESKESGEFEIGMTGEPVPIVDLDLHQYGNMTVLRDTLPQAIYDTVRRALGLEPLESAAKKGKAITEKVRSNLE